MEVSDGAGGEPRRDGGFYAGADRDWFGDFACYRSAYPTGGVCGVSISRQPVGLGVGHGLDMGTAGSSARIAWGCDRKRRAQMGRRRVARTTVAVSSVVVDLS